MRIVLLMTGAAAMAIAGPAMAKNPGKDHNKGAQSQAKDHGKSTGKAKPDKRDRSVGKSKQDKDRGNVAYRASGAGKAADKRYKEARRESEKRAKDLQKAYGDRRDTRRDYDRVVDTGRPGLANRISTRIRLIDGCPPGLAKKHNGCMPPGQAKKYYNDRYAYLFDGMPTRYRNRYDDSYRYNDGYLYRMNGDSVGGWLPILGGALGVGQIFPDRYPDSAVPTYYNAYYERDDRYRYRYADRAIFAVDPKTQAIQSIAALLTGDDWTVGQAAPSGYGVYNVPLSYRDRYYDTPDARYRYSDGYVYRIDPKTQLVAAAISLLT